MDHPLIDHKQKDIRQRVVHLLRTSYKARRFSNIIFVCGGNEDIHMRIRFRTYCIDNLPEFEIFFPEYAFENLFAIGPDEPFDIADFELLVGELSHAIVVFPEAAGSYAETGYFAAIGSIAKSCILVLNLKYQQKDSFISLGPAKKIAAASIFHPLIQIDYENPDFSSISERIKRINQRKYKKTLSLDKFKDLRTYEIACVIHEIVRILTIATIDDICFFFKVLFKNSYSEPKIRKLLSILVGAGLLKHIGDYGHVSINTKKPNLLELRDGYAEIDREIRLLLAKLYQDSDADFLALVEASRNVD